jgi:hypothetical protein
MATLSTAATIPENDQNLASSAPVPARRAPKHAAFEPIALVLLSLATVGTAWCSFQAAAWGGVSQRSMNLSAAASRRAAVNQLQAHQMALIDVLLFSQHMNARASSNETLARFYADRFRGEAKTAFDAWLATRPFDNANAPPHPFVTDLYKPRLLVQAGVDEAEGQKLWQVAGDAGRTSRSYVLITVLLACALFCGGTASKFETRWVRRSAVIVGLAAFLFAVVRLSSLPIRL